MSDSKFNKQSTKGKHWKPLALISLAILIFNALRSPSCFGFRVFESDWVVVGAVLAHSSVPGQIFPSHVPSLSYDRGRPFSFIDAFEGINIFSYAIFITEDFGEGNSIMGFFPSESAVVESFNFPDFMKTNYAASFTTYITPENRNFQGFLSLIPVFRDADGEIFLGGGLGMGTGGWGMGERVIFNNARVAPGFYITARLKYSPTKITIAQMDSTHNLIEYLKYTMCGSLTQFDAHPNAAYIIVEAHRMSPNGEIFISRNVYNRGEDDAFTTLIPTTGGSGNLRRQTTEILWLEEE